MLVNEFSYVYTKRVGDCAYAEAEANNVKNNVARAVLEDFSVQFYTNETFLERAVARGPAITILDVTQYFFEYSRGVLDNVPGSNEQ